MDPPQTLHGQLYLLAYDRTCNERRIVDKALFRFALRAAMLTDLHLAGHLRDEDGQAVGNTAPSDPLLLAVYEKAPSAWTRLIADDDNVTSDVVTSTSTSSRGAHCANRAAG